VAIVTGGAQGIGLEIASTLARAGAHVAIADIRGDAASESATRLRDQALSVEAHASDVSKRDDCLALAQEVLESVGRIDILVNSAGVALYGPSETFSETDWHRSIDVMLTAPFLMSQAVAPAMIRQKQGVILNLASITGVGGWPMRAAYNAAKAGVIGLTQVLATEWAEHNVRVNAISPGPIETVLMREAFEQGVASREQFERRAPAGRIGSVTDIAAAALFLASGRSSYVTGANLRVDGGWLAWANPDGEGFSTPSGDG
jgi:NAD(P)-dependent dehydrogenase (short-subunit alcohol dehydrogenase family)